MPQRNMRFSTRTDKGQPGPEVRDAEPLSLNEDGMATRNDNDQNRAADEAARTARTVTDETARVGEQTACAGADVFRRGSEAARDTVQSGLNMAESRTRSDAAVILVGPT